MLKVKKKPCDGECGELKVIWKNHKGKRYCQSCWKRVQIAVTGEKHKPTFSKPLSPRSPKRTIEEREYSRLRKEFLMLHPVCKARIPGTCTHVATDVHHRKGRVGALLLTVAFWLPVCRQCHTFIENNPEIAKNLGYSENRLS